jgi:ADP-heptose:LPS heptosyltransferase
MKLKLLIVELWGIGDLLIGTPFMQAASEKYEVTLLAKPHALELAPVFWPGIRVIPVVAPWTTFQRSRKYLAWSWPWRNALATRSLLRNEHFDLGFSVRWDPRDHFLLAAAGVKQRIGFPRIGSGALLTHRLQRPSPQCHRYDFWKAVAGAVGLSIPGRDALPLKPANRGFLLVHSGAAQPVRVWPLDRFKSLVSRLRGMGIRVRVACDPGQRSWWMGAGETEVQTPASVNELVELTRGAGAFIGNDSGPGHVAAKLGAPTFTIFGSQLPSLFAPLHREGEWIAGCPCPHLPCSDYCRFPQPNCIVGLSETMVWERVEAFVRRHTGQLETIR